MDEMQKRAMAAAKKTAMGQTLSNADQAELNNIFSVKVAQLLAVHDFARDLPPNDVEREWCKLSEKERRALVSDGFGKIFFASTVLSIVETAEEYAIAKDGLVIRVANLLKQWRRKKLRRRDIDCVAELQAVLDEYREVE